MSRGQCVTLTRSRRLSRGGIKLFTELGCGATSVLWEACDRATAQRGIEAHPRYRAGSERRCRRLLWSVEGLRIVSHAHIAEALDHDDNSDGRASRSVVPRSNGQPSPPEANAEVSMDLGGAADVLTRGAIALGRKAAAREAASRRSGKSCVDATSGYRRPSRSVPSTDVTWHCGRREHESPLSGLS